MLAPMQRQVLLTPPLVLRQPWFPAMLVGLITAGLLLWFTGPLCPDVSGQFWLAHAMRRGARLYLDVVEINPPLWFWLAMPIDWLAETLGVRTEPVTILVVAVAVLAAMGAVGKLLGHVDSPRRIAFLTYLGAILLIMPARQLEQREHIVLIGAIPYLVLAAARRRGEAVTPSLAVLIGVGAGLGFALKPYFMLVPILIELWLIASLRRAWRPVRAETLGLAATVAAYAVALAVVTPSYVTVTVPMLLIAYNGVGATLWDTLGFLPLFWLATLAGTLSQWRSARPPAAPITVALLIGALAFATAWAVQHKGWLYQGLPATGCFAIALAAVLVETGAPANRFVRLFAPALLLWPMFLALVDVETRITPDIDIAPALADLRPGDPLGLISTAGPTTWPSTIGRGLRMSSRYAQYWMINATDQRPNDPTAKALMTRVIRETALDYRCLPPKVIIFVDIKDKEVDQLNSSHPYRMFTREPEFAAVMSHYRLWRSGSIYGAWRQVSPLAPVDPAQCRRPG